MDAISIQTGEEKDERDTDDASHMDSALDAIRGYKQSNYWCNPARQKKLESNLPANPSQEWAARPML